MPKRLRSTLIEIISASLIFLFVYTAISKLITHDTFQSVLNKSPLVADFSEPVAWAIPIAEILLAIFLFFPYSRRLALFISALLMTTFTLYIAYMIVFIPNLPCSCGGVLNNLDWKEHLIFNVAISAIAFAGWNLTTMNKKEIIAITGQAEHL